MNTKYYKLLIGCSFLFLAITACEKNELRLTQFSLPQNLAYVKFALLSPGTTSVMIKINDVKINGANTSGSSGYYPSSTVGPDYAAVVPNGALKLSLPNIGTSNDSVVLFTGALAISASKFYAVCLADTGIDRTLFSVEDKLGALPDSGFFNLRLVNAMAKNTGLSLVRVDSTNSTVVTRDTVVRNLTFKNGSDFVRLPISPVNSFLRYRLVATATGTAIGNVITPPAANILNKRSTTIYASGFTNGTGSLAPALSAFYYNQ